MARGRAISTSERLTQAEKSLRLALYELPGGDKFEEVLTAIAFAVKTVALAKVKAEIAEKP